MWVWIILRCLFEVLGGATGLAHHFADQHSLYEVAAALLNFDDETRIVVMVFSALVVGGIIEIGIRLFRLVIPSAKNHDPAPRETLANRRRTSNKRHRR